MARNKYTAEEKEAALAMIEEVGLNEASRRLSISPQTLYAWRGAQPEEAADQPQKAKRYTQEQKESALLLASQIGIAKASEQLGITTKSLYSWRYEQKADTPETVAPAVATPKAEEPKNEGCPDCPPQMIAAAYPLRPDLTLSIMIPADITQTEATRLGDFVKTLYYK